MNILVLTHRPIFPPTSGYSRLIYDTYIELAEIESNIHIDILTIVAKPKQSGFVLPDLNVKNVVIKEPKDIFFRLLPSRLLLRMFHERCLSIHLENLMKTYGSNSLVTEIKTLIKRGYINQPDVIISETIYPITIAKKLSQLYNAPILLRAHNIEANYISSLSGILREMSYRKILKLESNALRSSNKVVVVSYYDKLVMKYMYKLDSVYIPPIIRIETGCDKKILAELGLEPFKYILFPASDHRPNREFLEYIIKAGKEIKKYNMDLVITGSISRYAKKYTGQAKILGILPYNTLNTLIKNAYLVVAPHHGNGTPIKVIEALCNGTPVLTTTNTLRSLIELKEEQYELVINNINDITKLIKILLKKNTLYKNLRKKVHRLSKLFCSKDLAKRYLKEINKTIRNY